MKRLLLAAAVTAAALSSAPAASAQDDVTWAQGCAGYYTWQWDPLHGGPYCPEHFVAGVVYVDPPTRPDEPDIGDTPLAPYCQRLTGRPNCQFLGP